MSPLMDYTRRTRFSLYFANSVADSSLLTGEDKSIWSLLIPFYFFFWGGGWGGTPWGFCDLDLWHLCSGDSLGGGRSTTGKRTMHLEWMLIFRGGWFTLQFTFALQTVWDNIGSQRKQLGTGKANFLFSLWIMHRHNCCRWQWFACSCVNQAERFGTMLNVNESRDEEMLQLFSLGSTLL